LPSASARYTSLPATASDKVRALRGQPPLKLAAKQTEMLMMRKIIFYTVAAGIGAFYFFNTDNVLKPLFFQHDKQFIG
jgi:hypothetical protein